MLSIMLGCSSEGRATALYAASQRFDSSCPNYSADGGTHMPIYKRCSRCGKRIPSGSACECAKRRHKEYDRYSRDKKSRSFYGSKEWEMGRSTALDIDGGIDVYLYMTEGVIVTADTVHHIIPLKDDWEKRIDIDNMMSLSSNTHSVIEQMYRKNKEGMIRKLQKMIKEYRGRRKDGGI